MIILRLPAHLTHLLQPFDRSVFRPVKLCWQQLLREFAHTHNGPVSKKSFPRLLKKLYEKAFTLDQTKSGFRACGIFPFNRDVVPKEELEPSPFVAQPAQIPTPSLPVASPDAILPVPTPTPLTPIPSASVSPEPSTSVTSIRDFFLKRLQPRFAGNNSTGRGRSARIQRFRYGVSLIGDECVARLREQENRKASTARGKGTGRGRGKQSRRVKVCRSRSPGPAPPTSQRSPSSSTSEDDTPCEKCGKSGGERWISCDVCDMRYHMNCIGLKCTPEKMAQ